MASHAIITLSDQAPTRLTPNGVHGGMDITVQNTNENGYIYIGVNEETSSTDYGFRLIPNQAISFELPGPDALYAIAETDAMTVAVLEIGLESQD